MEVYQELLERVVVKGRNKDDRTGTGTRSVFGEQIRFDLREGFPLLTTKRVHFKSVVGELLWFLHPVTNSNLSNRVLKEVYGVSIWDEWGDTVSDSSRSTSTGILINLVTTVDTPCEVLA